MKKLILAALVLVSAAVNAAEVVVYEAQLPLLQSSGRALVDARFQMDFNTNEGFMKVSVSEQRFIYSPDSGHYDQTGRWYPGGPGRYQPTIVIIFKDTAKIEGLMLMGDKVIYHGAEGDVDCGTIGESRVFRRPIIYLSGKCELVSTIVSDRYSDKLVVTLKTK